MKVVKTQHGKGLDPDDTLDIQLVDVKGPGELNIWTPPEAEDHPKLAVANLSGQPVWMTKAHVQQLIHKLQLLIKEL